MSTEPDIPTSDPNARTRVIVGAILLAVAWVLAAAFVLILLIVLPSHQVHDYAWAIIGSGLLAAGAATRAIIDAVMTD
jgi:TRAP-type mannitol/chloroaromatic compound transport system permease large subunit